MEPGRAGAGEEERGPPDVRPARPAQDERMFTSRLPKILTAALAAVALAPAAALAADNELRGAPQAFKIDAKTVQVQFVADAKLASPKRSRVVIADRGTATRVKADGRHGNDFRYVASVKLRRAVEVGKKYRVMISLDGGEPIERLVLVKAKR